jgi:hypothetical protein
MGGLELCGGTHHAAIRPEGGAGGLHLIRIYRFQLLQRGRPGFSVAAGLSAIALATADVPPAVLSAVALTKAEAGGILPPGPTPGFQPGAQIIQPSRAGVRFSAGRDARLYGRQDARRCHKRRIWCSPLVAAAGGEHR